MHNTNARLKFRLTTCAYTIYGLLLSSILFAHPQRPDEITRGGSREPEQIQIRLPLPEPTPVIDSWSEMASMVTVAVALIGVIQLLITKLMVMPAVAESIIKCNDSIKEWIEDADRKFVHTNIFAERQKQEDRRQDSIEKRQETIERRIEHIIDLINNNGRRP